VLTLQKCDNAEVISVSTDDKSVEDLLTKEWLLTNQRGGYASSTVLGCNTRRYHGLLIGSLNPPANRIMALANCLEMVIFNGKVFNLSTFEFNEKFAPEGFTLLKQFRRGLGVHFDYQLAQLQLTKSVYLLRDVDTVVLVYDFTRLDSEADFVLRPFVGLRDFHTLQKSYAPLKAYLQRDMKYRIRDERGLLIRHDVPNSCELFLSCRTPPCERSGKRQPCTLNEVDFEKDQQWWFNFVYRNDRERGQGFTEDLWTPGFFKCHIRPDGPAKVVFWANLRRTRNNERRITNSKLRVSTFDIRAILQSIEDLHKHQESVKCKPVLERSEGAKGIRPSRKSVHIDQQYETLCLAADQFITKCSPVPVVQATSVPELSHEPRTTIVAGFPWFADWGRDTFVALPGLLLSTSRFDEAKSVLTGFAAAADDGLIPNRFDDYGNTAYFNSVDASLWFINAAFQYLQAAGDSETFTQQLLPTIRWIIDSYRKGCRLGIHADNDGLITAGDEQTQLTWMDAKYDGVAFTPRYGKAVEVNALWYNSLCHIAKFYTHRDANTAKHYKSMAAKVAASFCRLFWNETLGYLNDCILPDGSADSSLRPNQIFAVSLLFSPLPADRQKAVVDVIEKKLLTPFGLRTLSHGDSRYKGIYTGPSAQRDQAYHQGTVWPYLIGPFVAAYLKVNNFSQESKPIIPEAVSHRPGALLN